MHGFEGRRNDCGEQLTCAVGGAIPICKGSDWNFVGGGGVLVIMKRSVKMTEMGLQVGDSVRFRES